MTNWGWMSQDRPAGVHWIPGTLEDSYARISRFGGRWILVASNPASEYRRIMAETAEEKEGSKS